METDRAKINDMWLIESLKIIIFQKTDFNDFCYFNFSNLNKYALYVIFVKFILIIK